MQMHGRKDQVKYDEAWKTRDDSNLPREFETEEYIDHIEFSPRRQLEREQASVAARTAMKPYQKNLERPSGSPLPAAIHMQRMMMAISKLDAAKALLEAG